MSWRVAPAGVVSGPRKLKIVRTASSLRTGTTKRVAWWWAGANMKPKPTSRMQAATASGPRSIRAPSASSTSADPDMPVALRLPCLATGQPAAAATSAAVGETLNVGRPPPVPAVSRRSSRPASTGVASSRMVRARPASSSTVSPLARRPMRKAAISISEASPRMTSSSTAAASSVVRSQPEASASIASVRTGLGKLVGVGLCPPTLQEVPQEPLAGLREHRLGVELDALGGQAAVADAHEDAAAVGGGLQLVGQALGRDHERVVAPDRQRVGQAGVDALAVMGDVGGLAVDRVVGGDGCAERLPHRLMPQADAEGGHAGLGEAAGDREADAGLVRRARAGRDHDALVGSLEQPVGVGLVVADDLDVRAQLAEVLDEVVGEAVVVVDDEDPHGQSGCRTASSIALSTPRALATDSSYS